MARLRERTGRNVLSRCVPSGISALARGRAKQEAESREPGPGRAPLVPARAAPLLTSDLACAGAGNGRDQQWRCQPGPAIGGGGHQPVSRLIAGLTGWRVRRSVVVTTSPSGGGGVRSEDVLQALGRYLEALDQTRADLGGVAARGKITDKDLPYVHERLVRLELRKKALLDRLDE